MQSQDGNAKQEKRDGFYLRGFPKNPSKYRYDMYRKRLHIDLIRISKYVFFP